MEKIGFGNQIIFMVFEKEGGGQKNMKNFSSFPLLPCIDICFICIYNISHCSVTNVTIKSSKMDKNVSLIYLVTFILHNDIIILIYGR